MERDEVIDLREPAAVVRLPRDDNPFASLTKEERLRVIIRVLCELVAYGESDAAGGGCDLPAEPVIVL